MTWLFVAASALLGYLLGAIPVGLIVCRLFGVDIRTVGSGRTGATNAWRAAGLKAAIPTVLGDALKGAVAIWLVRWLFGVFFPEPDVMEVSVATARLSAQQWAAALAGGFAGNLALPTDGTGWLGLVLLTVLYGSAITAIFTVVPRLGAATNTTALNFEPIAALALGWVVLGQELAARQMVGALLVVAAVVLIGSKRH